MKVQMTTENHSNRTRGKAVWDVETVNIFCDMCIAEVDAGNRLGTHFSRVGWENMVANICKETNKVYSKVQLKTKLDALKNDQKLWKQLVGKETDLGWNDKKKTIDALEEWWLMKHEVGIVNMIILIINIDIYNCF